MTFHLLYLTTVANTPSDSPVATVNASKSPPDPLEETPASSPDFSYPPEKTLEELSLCIIFLCICNPLQQVFSKLFISIICSLHLSLHSRDALEVATISVHLIPDASETTSETSDASE